MYLGLATFKLNCKKNSVGPDLNRSWRVTEPISHALHIFLRLTFPLAYMFFKIQTSYQVGFVYKW